MVILTSIVMGSVILHTRCKKDGHKLKTATAVITPIQSGSAVSGVLNFSELANGKIMLDLTVTVPARADQSVAVHIHEHGDCGDGGNGAHGHWNPTGKPHGQWGSSAFHAGDIGNIPLDANGRGRLMIESNLWSIGGDSVTNILHRGIIVHGGVDDYTTQPSGNSGPRIGCAMIMEK
ncbi:superoxide dismutase family protein [Paraflavitalea speifideaquila]|uniref:superoxide dismutase family protein n=1 Tax=Paraflavitalea speifideaquila TaxID=3076558 RepID=UPI0028E97263|nr:superoxide dismutase family protein [Paraflavitalea speifideiaquila]